MCIIKSITEGIKEGQNAREKDTVADAELGLDGLPASWSRGTADDEEYRGWVWRHDVALIC